MTPVDEKPGYYTIEIVRGREGLPKNTLSAVPNSNQVDFWYADDGSGRQQWYIPNFKNEVKAEAKKIYDTTYKDQAIKNLDKALSLIDFSKVKIAFEGSELGDDSIFNALPFTFWVSSEEGKSKDWGSSLLSLKTHFNYYVKPNSEEDFSKVG